MGLMFGEMDDDDEGEGGAKMSHASPSHASHARVDRKSKLDDKQKATAAAAGAVAGVPTPK